MLTWENLRGHDPSTYVRTNADYVLAKSIQRFHPIATNWQNLSIRCFVGIYWVSGRRSSWNIILWHLNVKCTENAATLQFDIRLHIVRGSIARENTKWNRKMLSSFSFRYQKILRGKVREKIYSYPQSPSLFQDFFYVQFK